MSATTQSLLEILDIKDGVLILKDKSLREILIVSSINFPLKSNIEQEAILYQFQNFLNSLDFPIQILVQSRRVNITGYIDQIKSLENLQPNPLLKNQVREYCKFISELVGGGKIFTKSFFIIIPYYIPIYELKKEKEDYLSEDTFERARYQLAQRRDFIMMGLARCGLDSFPLGTREVIEFLWNLYHLAESEVGYYPEIPPEFVK